MRILVLNGSPKGKYSVTLQTCRYLEILHPEHSFAYLNVGQKIKFLEKDLSPALEAIGEADLLLFSYPVYTFLAPSQLQKFIRLLKESGADLSGKFATQISTSKHFYDSTAQRYIEDNCYDLGLHYIRGLTADMDDLTTREGQKQARDFFDFLCWNVRQNHYEPLPAPRIPTPPVPVKIPAPSCPVGGNVVIITDCEPENTQLAAMIDRFRAVMQKKTKVVNLHDFPFKGGCLGCFKCAITGKCVYPDRFDEFLRNEIQTADAMVYAFTLRDHSMGPLFKMYDDRQFCNGHRTVTAGTPVGYLISGNYSVETNLQTVIEGRSQVGVTPLAGVATDEFDPNGEIDRMADTLCYLLDHPYVPPQNFYGIGGMKIFRDLIWIMQGLMKADHKFYKSHGQYDFPQKQWPRMLQMQLVGGMMASKKIQKKMGNQMNDGILMPYEKVLKEARASVDKTAACR